MCPLEVSRDVNAMPRPPDISKAAISKFLRRLYPFKLIEVASIKQLPSYEDSNCYFRGTVEDVPSTTLSQEYVLKISNSSNSFELVEGIGAVMIRLNSPASGICCSCPVSARSGGSNVKLLSTSQLLEGEVDVRTSERCSKFCVQVLSYLPGVMLNSVELTPRLAFEIGEYVGKMDAALKDFSHPVINSREFSETTWDLKHFLQVSKFVSSIEDSCKRTMVERVLGDFEKHVQPHLTQLVQGVIHADATTSNIIVLKGMENENHVKGVIDFSDCHKSCYIFELAVLLAKLSNCSKGDPITIAVPVIAGYMKAFPLPELDLKCLFPAVLARLCQVAVITEVYGDPGNQYTCDITEQSWKVLENLMKYSKSDVDRTWKTGIEDLELKEQCHES